MPRLVRRAPLTERLKNYLNPLDFLLWLSEELNSLEWEEYKGWSLPAGVAINLIFLIARANSGGRYDELDDDIFGEFDETHGSGWFNWLCSIIVYVLSIISFTNAFYTFLRKRHYRLFEKSLDDRPLTPHARRVRVDSSPLSSSPLRFFSEIVSSTNAASRAHPDETQHVWEVRVWDPTPICLNYFCFFSPGHVMIYWSYLPTVPLDPRPSVTIATSLFLCALLSIQLNILQKSFSQQAKDLTLVHKEVLNEYDAKFVHPSLTQIVREVGTQTYDESTRCCEVDASSPFYLINRGFRTYPNPAYAQHYDPDNNLQKESTARQIQKHVPRASTTPNFTRASYEHEFTTSARSNNYTNSSTASGTELSSPSRPAPSRPHTAAYRPIQPQYVNDGGSLGVYQHAASPLRKAASLNVLRSDDGEPKPRRREGSPLKRMSTQGGELGRRLERLRGPGGKKEREIL